ncbi:hypothetical protein FQR65_LT18974 [Abscondita terminalis]|nr:hypothetical protein FQR65_LT18974 [Abscondita terminalis]
MTHHKNLMQKKKMDAHTMRASVHTITQRGDTPLLMCLRKSPPNASNIKLIQRLLALGCDFESANNEGVSPLQLAVLKGIYN